MSAEFKNANETPPIRGLVHNIDTTTSSAATNLETLLGVDPSENFISMISTVDVYWFLGESTDSVDPTAESGLTQGALLKANTEKRFKIPVLANGTAYKYLIHEAGSNGQLRLWVSSSNR